MSEPLPWWSAEYHAGYQRARRDAAERILAYAEKHHPRHDARFDCGRCDLTAAYRYAADLARGETSE